jgi:5-histidylcysteine sulfoxide synthase/putative 4-mercaptohistidine N1-methyltranferase
MPLTPTPARTPRLDTGNPAAKREEIRRYFHDTFDVYEQLFELLADDEAYVRRADPLRHPLIFYFGHTACFFINKLVLAKLIPARVNPRFESMFAIGVDEMSWDDLDERNYDWPQVAEVREYRRQVRAVVDRAISELPLSLPIGWDDPFWVILMGIEHERIHLETSSVLIRQLPLSLLREHPDWPVCPRSGPAPQNELRDVPAGAVVLGKNRDHALYGWDNEYGKLTADIPSFRAARYLTTNGEFLAFVEAGGYQDQRWWTEEGWSWRTFQQAEHPRFWRRDDEGGWRLRCVAKEVPMPWDWPVEVNQLEAKAFCDWQAAATGLPIRLPTEEEWYRLLDHAGIPDQPHWEREPGNINLAHFASSCPVTEHVHGGFGDIVGNVWQWTETPITGFAGFAVHPLYDDFSTPTFDTRHNLIKGGSWISTGNEATRDSRYAFRRHFYQHAGFRYIASDAPVVVREDVYETDALVAQYCEFHWGDEYFGVPSFPRRLADLCAELSRGRPTGRALDLGCATGRATFELARTFDHVTGIDFSARFIRVGHELQQKGYTRYAIPVEGELVSYHEAQLADFGLDGLAGKVEFWQGDAHNLKPQFTDYDLILAANLIDRLYDPARFLADVHTRLAPGGLLVITSPYTWLEEFTPRDRWLGGIKVDGENVTTRDGLAAALAPHFEPVGEPRDLEFVIRETARKFQHTVAEVTVWRRVEV